MMSWWEERSQFIDTVAVVSGGAGGLGGAVTDDLIANGVRVAVLDRDDAALSSMRERYADVDAIFQLGDARDPAVLEALFSDVDQRWGRLDSLVNVVGGTFRAAFEDTNERGWDALLKTNLMHVFHACSLAIPRMKAGKLGGSIVNFTTIEAHRGAPNFAVYSAAKAAVTHFSRTLAVELAADGIRVNCVAPDITPTPNMGLISAQSSTFLDPVGAAIALPMARVGVPTDVSSAVVFLLSGLSRYITGTTLHPDGGTWASSGWFNWPDSGYGNTIPSKVLDSLRSTE
jgi:3-oxoacyl-[acyl-carrier protein] reductase